MSFPITSEQTDIIWPEKRNIFGVSVSPTTYEEAITSIMEAARKKISSAVSALAVHGLMLAAKDKGLRTQVNDFQIVAPDGQPVRVALNLLHHSKLSERVYGPELMLRLCERSMKENIGIYLYGSTSTVIERLKSNLLRRFPKLQIVGYEPSQFRPLTAEEDAELVNRINGSGAGLLFVGLGCPLQEGFAASHLNRIHAVQICIGAAFDFHAGNKKMAPSWMQQHGLEWFFRLIQEPRRLWKRYLTTNSKFILMLLLQWSGIKKFKNSQGSQLYPSD